MRYSLNVACISLMLASSVLSHGDDAESVSVAEFKAGFVGAQIVPEITAKFVPSRAFYAGFTSSDGGLLCWNPA
jgi:hypothetical protein